MRRRSVRGRPRSLRRPGSQPSDGGMVIDERLTRGPSAREHAGTWRSVRERAGRGHAVVGTRALRYISRRQSSARHQCPQAHAPSSPVMAASTRPAPVVLIVLDGWGYRAEADGNAIAMATVPTWDR